MIQMAGLAILATALLFVWAKPGIQAERESELSAACEAAIEAHVAERHATDDSGGAG